MGRASSAKKVAKVARSSGGPRREQAKLGFPVAVFAVLVVGVLLVTWARSDRNAAVAEAPTLADHWHAAYGIYVCDTFQPGLVDVGPDTTGIHTHDDGTVHVHPFSSASAGSRATWARFGEIVGLEFDGAAFTMPDGTRYEDGHDCGGEPARVVMYQWPADDLEAEPVIHTEDLGDVRFTEDRLAFTLAVVPEGTEVPRPPSVPTLDNLSDVVANPNQPETSVPEDRPEATGEDGETGESEPATDDTAGEPSGNGSP
jgi:hypothetical protein